MFNIVGNFVSKSIIASGTNEYGEWKIIRFAIEKQYRKKKKKFYFTAKNKNATFVSKLMKGHRISVKFFPEQVVKDTRVFTELMAEEVHYYVKKDRLYQTIINGEIKPDLDIEFGDDLTLFD